MRNLKDAKDIYDHIVVPEELDDRLRKVLESAPAPKKKPVKKVVVRNTSTAMGKALAEAFGNTGMELEAGAKGTSNTERSSTFSETPKSLTRRFASSSSKSG